MQPDEPINRDPLDVAEAVRSADFELVKKKAKFFGCLALANLIAFAFVLKGMPLHLLWPFIGPVLGISLVFLSATAGHYLVMHITDSWWRFGNRNGPN